MSALPLLGSGFQRFNDRHSHSTGFLNRPCASATATPSLVALHIPQITTVQGKTSQRLKTDLAASCCL
jgi:hypothetical protein